MSDRENVNIPCYKLEPSHGLVEFLFRDALWELIQNRPNLLMGINHNKP